MGPRDPKSTVLTPVEEAMIIEYRQRTLLPLDDVLGCLKDSIPKLTRSSFRSFSKRSYKGRNVIERCFCRLEDFRRAATRCDKLAGNFLAAVLLAAIVDYWINWV